jgi:hypothetical protein
MPVPGIDLPWGEKVAMVYSCNQEFGAIQTELYSANQTGRAGSLWHEMKRLTDFGKWTGTYASSTPAKTVQLQAADIFADELCKESMPRPTDAPVYASSDLSLVSVKLSMRFASGKP